MLVLTRKLGECIHIGNEVKLTVVEIRGQQIRLGIDAPKSVPILRSELASAELKQPNEYDARPTCPAGEAVP